MRCPKCGFEGDGKFCAQCGTPMEELRLVSSDDPVIPVARNEADTPGTDPYPSKPQTGAPYSGASYYGSEPPGKQGIGAKFGAFWRKNKRNKILVIIAALIVIGIVRSIIGGIGSPDTDTQESYDQPATEATQAISEPEETEAVKEAEEEEETTEAAEEKESGDEVSADFKESMDEYEEFMNEYVEFMKKYENSDDTASMLVDYGQMMSQYAEFTEKIDAIDEDELSDADYAYYMKVTGRVTEKLAELY